MDYQDTVPIIMARLTERFGSRYAAARAIGVHAAQFTRWGKGEQRPSVDTLRNIARHCPECQPLIDGLFQP